MSLTDLQNARTAYMTAVDEYKAAVASGDVTAITAALENAKTHGKTYMEQMGVEQTNDPNLTPEQLFSRAGIYSDSRRKIIDRAWGVLKTLTRIKDIFDSLPRRPMMGIHGDYAYFLNPGDGSIDEVNLIDASTRSTGPKTYPGTLKEFYVDADLIYVCHQDGSRVYGGGSSYDFMTVFERSTLSVLGGLDGGKVNHSQPFVFSNDDQSFYALYQSYATKISKSSLNRTLFNYLPSGYYGIGALTLSDSRVFVGRYDNAAGTIQTFELDQFETAVENYPINGRSIYSIAATPDRIFVVYRDLSNNERILVSIERGTGTITPVDIGGLTPRTVEVVDGVLYVWVLDAPGLITINPGDMSVNESVIDLPSGSFEGYVGDTRIIVNHAVVADGTNREVSVYSRT